ncbi:single-stranded DNA-binding protein [Paludibacter sp. 221]|uniref:single-stranded DNA-binding protein n=1 Tax=Paludibacter sp. 221 TaxID=2302939 RepID=UPI0013CF6392|nr:single-stranded DNA-binding protein [Paludibacter sp. 221]NDV47591.1 single-stranded DNA-binding protein [Paludibacter sp. 221]
MSINKVILVGNVGRDPEVRYLDNNVSVANFTVATTERGYTMQNGTQVPERTEWHNIVAWRGLADLAEKYIRKGTQLYVEGKIQTRSWEKDGIKRYTTEIYADTIQLLGRRGDRQEEPPTAAPASSPSTAAPSSTPTSAAPQVDDDLPF